MSRYLPAESPREDSQLLHRFIVSLRGLCVLCGKKTFCMNVDSIRAYCLAFPDATERLQWEDELCFKIGGKIFAMLGLDRLRLCFKCAPDAFAELIEREDIRPAPYVGRYKWVMLDRLDALGQAELKDFIRQSYDMVVAKAPKRKASPRSGARGRVAAKGTSRRTAKKKSAKSRPAHRAGKKSVIRRKSASRKPKRR
jgi:predicted DNA-binding protein (MmcQ/YjbR family)